MKIVLRVFTFLAIFSILTLTYRISAETNNYIDTKSGLTFTIPEGWIKTDFIKERQAIEVKYVNADNSGDCIIFGSKDIYSLMSESDRSNYKRSDIDNSIYTTADVAEIYSIPEYDVTMVMYNSVKYFQANKNTSTIVNGNTVSIEVQYLMCIRDGMFYTFQFSVSNLSSNPSKHLSDYKSILEGARYPDLENLVTDSMGINAFYFLDIIFSIIITALLNLLFPIIFRVLRKSPMEKKRATRYAILNAIVVFIIFIILAILMESESISSVAAVIWFYPARAILRYGHKKTESGKRGFLKIDSFPLKDVSIKSDTVQKASPVSTKVLENPKKLFCQNCGKDLPVESLFCLNCGTEVNQVHKVV